MRYGMLLLATLVTGCSTDSQSPQGELSPTVSTNEPRREGSVGEVDVDGLKAALDGDEVALLVDVRTPEEFATGHVPGAVNIPVHELGERKSELEPHRDDAIHVICQSGGRSSRAAQMLSAGGWDAINVAGGTGAWKNKGYPTE